MYEDRYEEKSRDLVFRKTGKYGMSGIFTALVALAVSVLPASATSGAVSEQNQVYSAGDNSAVFITPAFGKYPKPLLVTVTPDELRVVNNAQAQMGSLNKTNPLTARLVTWFIEPSAQNSPTVNLARKSLLATQAIFESMGIYDAKATSIVIGRSQQYIKRTVEKLGCFPDLSRTRGQYLMGSSLCNDTVIVMNLTGYLFLTSANQQLSTYLEKRAEPPLASMNYLIVDRNISGLSHEWAHSVRTLMAGGDVPPGEPAWMREGFAELVAGLSRVKAFPVRMSYMDFHAIKIHLFSNWPSRCKLELHHYRLNAPELAGCEYYNGLMATELLLSDHGGLASLMQLYKETGRTRSFEQSFFNHYAMTLDEFEFGADAYISEIAKIGFLRTSAQAQ